MMPMPLGFAASNGGLGSILHSQVLNPDIFPTVGWLAIAASMLGAQHMAARAGDEQADLRLLDPVLCLAALAVQAVVQCLGFTRQVGDDETRV